MNLDDANPDDYLGFQPAPETLEQIDEALAHAAAARYWPYVDRLLERRFRFTTGDPRATPIAGGLADRKGVSDERYQDLHG